MHFELWDTESRNLVEDFDSEDEALQAARELIALNSDIYPRDLALARHDYDGTTSWLARGATLGVRVSDGDTPSKRHSIGT